MVRKKERLTKDAGKMVKTTCTFEPEILTDAKALIGYGKPHTDLSGMINYLLAVYTGRTKPFFGTFIVAPGVKPAESD